MSPSSVDQPSWFNTFAAHPLAFSVFQLIINIISTIICVSSALPFPSTNLSYYRTRLSHIVFLHCSLVPDSLNQDTSSAFSVTLAFNNHGCH
jgi:hypothetical protein